MVSLFKALSKQKGYTHSVPNSDGWGRLSVSEPFSGAWQRNIEYRKEDVLSYHAVFSCISLIASDISKCKIKLTRKSTNGIWSDIPYGNYNVIRKPNDYQNRIQFIEGWLNSKLIRGNAYIWKERSGNRIKALHILHPDKVLPLVAPDGEVFYQLSEDNLAGIVNTSITVPATEIIHDRFNCFYHPLVGLSPLYAAGLPAFMGSKIVQNSAHTFANGARPSGILTIPEAITPDRAKELSDQWESKYGGENYGKTAILGGDLKYTALSMKAEELQLVEQLKMTAEMVCSTFHVPAYKVIGNAPAYNNVEAMEQSYYSQCLQILIESVEECLKDGFNLDEDVEVKFDLDNLLRMDSKSQIETLGTGTTKALYAPNEARKKLNLPPVDGGDTPFLQEQNWPINELVNRPSDKAIPETNDTDEVDNQERMIGIANMFRKELLNGS